MVNGRNIIEAEDERGVADTCVLCGVEEPDASYKMPPEEIAAGNWFDEETGESLMMEYPAGRFSVRDTVGDIFAHPQGKTVMAEAMTIISAASPAAAEMGKGSSSFELLNSVKYFPMQQVLKMLHLKPLTIIRVNRLLNGMKKED